MPYAFLMARVGQKKKKYLGYIKELVPKNGAHLNLITHCPDFSLFLFEGWEKGYIKYMYLCCTQKRKKSFLQFDKHTVNY